MEILDKADQLGKLIAQSEQLMRYKEAEEALLNDKELNEELNSYKEMYLSYSKNKNSELEKEINITFDRLNQNSVFKEFVISKDNFDKLMQSVNSLISYYAGTESSGCSSGKCGGCGK